ncbi:ABC transporter permease subunit [Roseburia hominis]|uniref:ABC transporter permease n=1 Tax=Roseburia hominis TaxID=301301 RepID=UPI002016C0D9|nr:ABC transporter permease subunit [Roseburia hominis]MCL3784782.1 ABC transporter permease subunit [Roseburia hominis]
MVKKWGQRIYLAVIFLFLYLPILVLIVLSFNNSKSRVVWGGFTLKWYASCFTDETIMNAFVTTLQVTLTAAIVSTVIGTLAAIGISAMKRKNRSIMLGATPMYAFYKVTWPEIKSGVFSGFLMAVTMSLDDFSITFFTKGAGVNTLATMLYTELRKGVRPELYALSTILFAFLLLLVMNRRSDRIAGNHAGIH